jgi:hypothetical protein
VLFISGEFFKDFQEHKTTNGIDFRKKKSKTIYVNFPDELLVQVEGFPRKCTPEITPPDYASGLMENPSFELAWKKGEDEANPVKLIAEEEHHNPMGLVWSYLLTVPSTAVPLTDSLLIEVSLRHGMCRMHLIASLDSRRRSLFPSTCAVNGSVK